MLVGEAKPKLPSLTNVTEKKVKTTLVAYKTKSSRNFFNILIVTNTYKQLNGNLGFSFSETQISKCFQMQLHLKSSKQVHSVLTVKVWWW